MAIWQYSFHVLPKHEIDVHNLNFSLFCREEGFDSPPFWKERQCDKHLFDPLSTILQKEKSWANYFDLYGDKDSTCVKVLHEPNSVIDPFCAPALDSSWTTTLTSWALSAVASMMQMQMKKLYLFIFLEYFMSIT
jgi:hypothetical protein